MIFSKKQKKEIPKDIKEIFNYMEKLEKRVLFLEEELEKQKKESLKSFSKIAIERFNPFQDMGSNQSFALVILNNENNGFILTSLYAREESRIFTKPINNGISEYPLLKEEERVLKKITNE